MTKEQILDFTRRITQENHSGLILILCDMDDVYIHDAIEAYNSGNEADYLKNIELAKRVHNELMSCFNPSEPTAREVLVLLRYMYQRLVSSAVKRQPVDLETVQDMLSKLRVGLVHLHEIDTEGPVMKNAHQVYAGLTYGKGTLNEDTLGGDYSKRGYLA